MYANKSCLVPWCWELNTLRSAGTETENLELVLGALGYLLLPYLSLSSLSKLSLRIKPKVQIMNNEHK